MIVCNVLTSNGFMLNNFKLTVCLIDTVVTHIHICMHCIQVYCAEGLHFNAFSFI